MSHAQLPKGARILVAVGASVALLGLGSGAVFAGEITGNGTLKEVHGRSACANSGQEDLQWFTDDVDRIPRRGPDPRRCPATRSRGARSTRGPARS